MKKQTIIVFTLIILILLAFAGCGSNNTVSTKDGTITAGDNVSWPQDSMGDLPKPNAKITAVVKDDATGCCAVTFSDMTNSDAVSYISAIKQQGYQAATEFTDNENIMFSGQKNKAIVTFTYNKSSAEGSVSYIYEESSSNENQSGNSNDNVSNIDMSDISPWPSNFMPNIPELKGKIVNVLNQNNETIEINMEYVEKTDFEAYIAVLKQNGYTVDADEVKDSNSYDYRAYNKNGDFINPYMRFGDKTVIIYMEKSAE